MDSLGLLFDKCANSSLHLKRHLASKMGVVLPCLEEEFVENGAWRVEGDDIVIVLGDDVVLCESIAEEAVSEQHKIETSAKVNNSILLDWKPRSVARAARTPAFEANSDFTSNLPNSSTSFATSVDPLSDSKASGSAIVERGTVSSGTLASTLGGLAASIASASATPLAAAAMARRATPEPPPVPSSRMTTGHNEPPWRGRAGNTTALPEPPAPAPDTGSESTASPVGSPCKAAATFESVAHAVEVSTSPTVTPRSAEGLTPAPRRRSLTPLARLNGAMAIRGASDAAFAVVKASSPMRNLPYDDPSDEFSDDPDDSTQEVVPSALRSQIRQDSAPKKVLRFDAKLQDPTKRHEYSLWQFLPEPTPPSSKRRGEPKKTAADAAHVAAVIAAEVAAAG
mmetsp:Transcript_46666/g.129885  ORF Transcript_46666/g.129885 Transcript_46666/m.129885 type:complete len:397 (-) Transcript_46666:178-1368(-)